MNVQGRLMQARSIQIHRVYVKRRSDTFLTDALQLDEELLGVCWQPRILEPRYFVLREIKIIAISRAPYNES